MSPLVYGIIVVIYVLVMLSVGYWCMKRTKTVGDFFLGGRTLGPWMSAFAFGTTYFSAVLFIGYAGKLGWGFGIHTMWIVLGNTLIGTILAWWLLAGRTREMTARLNALTLPEFLHARYRSKGMQIIAAIVIFLFLLPYSASVYTGLGYLFQGVFNIPYNSALIFLAVLTGVYLVMGGYFAVAVSDFIRGIVEFIGVFIMVMLLAGQHGGIFASWNKLASSPAYMPALFPPPLPPGTTPPPAPPGPHFEGWIILLSLVIVTSFGPWALPQMVQKFYSIRAKTDVTRAMIIAGIFALFMAFGAYFTGALTHLFYGDFPQALVQDGAKNYDMLMPYFLTDPGINLSHGLVLIILLMIFSASMSSLSSLVLVSSSAISIDIFKASFKNMSQAATMSLMRVLCAVFVAVSLLVAMSKFDVIVNLMVIAWGTMAGAFLAPYLYGLFWKRTTTTGAFAGMLSGLATSIGLFVLWGKPNIPAAGAVAMIVPLIVVPVVSLLTPPPPQTLVDAAFTDAQPTTKTEEKATV